MLGQWRRQSNLGNIQFWCIHWDDHLRIQWLHQSWPLQLEPISAVHRQWDIAKNCHCHPNKCILYLVCIQYIMYLTWQVPVFPSVPIEHKVVFCTMFPKVCWHSSLVTIRTISLFKSSLMDELSSVLPHPAATISDSVMSMSIDSFNGRQAGRTWSK